MTQFIEFIGNHWLLVSLWLGLLTGLIWYQQSKLGKSVSTQQAVMLINRADGVVLDIREKKDYSAGHIVDAIHIPLAKLADRRNELEKYKSKPIIVTCKLGQHSAEASKILQQAGFTQVSRLFGGISEWRAQNLPLIQG